ncbi:DUF1320 domain-containing protein [uncultured Endozoicomonas sp.]|uniref:gp436 family protein n=1 Tax=uncultured Endozoicomonas sp. TaxID=432652 RepID=UPI00262ABFFC|nr:DUF1320 domain-containing protein [uncultured Endozoicomonas sp.]
MTAYATQQDIIDRIGEDNLLVLIGDDSVAVERAISQATDEITLYLGRRYVLPLATVPTSVRNLCVTIALYWLADDAAGMTELAENRYKAAVKNLEQLAKGTISLGMPDAERASENSAGNVQLVTAERRLTRKSLGGVL